MLIVSTRRFPEYLDGSNAGTKYEIRLRANTYIMALAGRAKESDKQHGKQQKLKTAVNKLLSLMYRKKRGKQQSN